MKIVRGPTPYHGCTYQRVPLRNFLLKKVEPEYPHETKGAGLEADVVFRIIVGTNGRVEEIHLRRGKPFLIEAAAKAVSKWQYHP
jgi:protein TonB